jgi:hypothetical protein
VKVEELVFALKNYNQEIQPVKGCLPLSVFEFPFVFVVYVKTIGAITKSGCHRVRTGRYRNGMHHRPSLSEK